MKNITKKLMITLLITLLAAITIVAKQNDRIKLKKGKAEVKTTIAAGKTKTFVISGKQFKKLKMLLKSKSKYIQVEIKSPKSKTLSKGKGKSYTFRNVSEGDYQIIITNKAKLGKAALIMKFDGIEGH